MTPTRVPSEAELLGWFETLSNWERFGADDALRLSGATGSPVNPIALL